MRLQSDERGAALVEMAVVIPVLLTIGLGVLEFGNAIYAQHLIFNGVRDGARYAAGRPVDCGCDTDIKNIALKGVISGGAYRLSWWNNLSQVTVTRTSTVNDDGAGHKLYRGGATIPKVTVTATLPYQSLGFLSFFGLNAPTLSVSHQERVFSVR